MLNIAQVGAFKRFSLDDTCRMAVAMMVISSYDREFFKPKPKHNVINLAYGRDFLVEDEQYDLVVLHSILHCYASETPEGFAAVKERAKKIGKEKGKLLLLSPHHSIDKWRERLMNCGATFIVICEGGPATLSGWKIGDIAGYEILQRDSKITLYRKV